MRRWCRRTTAQDRQRQNWLFCAAQPRRTRHRQAAHSRQGPQRVGPVLSHVSLTALLIANGDADLCIRMRRQNSLTSAIPGVSTERETPSSGQVPEAM